MSRPIRCANSKARKHVQALEEFQGSNLFAAAESNGIYAVWSYGRHWVLFAYDALTNRWYENEDKCSVSTSKHRSQAHPLCETGKLSRRAIERLVLTGTTD